MESDLDDLQAALDDASPATIATIGEDLACVRCGESLRDAPRAGVCPQCEAPVAISLNPARLHYASPHWLLKVRRGLIWMALSMFAWVPVAYVLKWVLKVMDLPGLAAALIALLVPIACTTILAIGAFKLTVAEPLMYGGVGHDRAMLRRFIRAACIIVAIAVPAFWLPTIAPHFFESAKSSEPPPWLLTALRFGLLSVPVLIYATLAYLRTLALRMPNASLARSTGIVLIGLPVSITALAILWTPLSLATLGAGLFTLVFAVWSLVLIWSYAIGFDESIRGAIVSAKRMRETDAATDEGSGETP